VLIDGLSAERVLYPDRVTPERQLEMLDRLLSSFRLPAADMTDDGLAAADAG
jgi:hypothetical protein